MYLDLFDDHLYWFKKGNIEYSSQATAKAYCKIETLCAVRAQMLFAILFRNVIDVPEQWLHSSRTFALVAGDILNAWYNVVSDSKSESRPRVPFPFRFVYIDRGHGGHGIAIRSILQRIELNRPLRLAPGLEDFVAREGGEGRLAGFKMTLKKLLEDKNESAREALDDELCQLLGEPHISNSYSVVLRYALSHAAEKTQILASDANYHQHLAGSVQSVFAALQNESFAEQFKARNDLFLEFFREVNEKKILPHEITKMWGEGKKMGEPRASTITLMGRYCMHRALASWADSSAATQSYTYFGKEQPDLYVHSLMDQARLKETGALVRDLKSAPKDLDKFVLQASAKYPVSDLILSDKNRPDELWRQAFLLSVSPDWIKLLDRLTREARTKILAGRAQDISANQLIDKLSAHFVGMAFSHDFKNKDLINITDKRVWGAISEGLGFAGKGIRAGFGEAVSSAARTIGLNSFVAVSFGYLISRLLKINPVWTKTLSLAAVRKVRELVK